MNPAPSALRAALEALNRAAKVVDSKGEVVAAVVDLVDSTPPASAHLVEEPHAPIIEGALESVSKNIG